MALRYAFPRRIPCKKLPMWRPISAPIGGAVSGCEIRQASSKDVGQASSECTTVPGMLACSRTASACG